MTRVAVVDVHYPGEGGARGAAVLCADASCARVLDERVAELAEVAGYEPGRFWLRELPVLHAVLTGVEFGLLVVDGYADLAPGLPQADAARLVAAMSGSYRLPDAVRRADALARGRT